MSLSPVPAVIAVIVHEGRTLLVRRANPPDAGLWGFPGGKIEFGETVKDAAMRELLEETGVVAQAQDIITTLDILVHDPSGAMRQHYILIAVQCRWISGDPVAGDDAIEARWFPIAELDPDRIAMSADVDSIARRAQALASNPARIPTACTRDEEKGLARSRRGQVFVSCFEASRPNVTARSAHNRPAVSRGTPASWLMNAQRS